MQQLRPYNQGQTHLAYRRTSWGLGDISETELGLWNLPLSTPGVDYWPDILAASYAKQLGDTTITPANAQPAPSGVMWIAIGFIVAMGMGLFDGPRKYGR